MRLKPVALPAKLSPPRLHNAVPRERLFAELDALRERHAAVWIGGIPGAGKTTLIASYCTSRMLRCVWYRLDANDNDLAGFFQLYGQAIDAQALTSKTTQRPVFDAEHLRQPRAFARAWFRSAFAVLPRPVALVLDNLEHAALPSLPELLACAIDELPEGITLLMTSRHAPPAELAGARLTGALAAMTEADLQFNTNETAAYAHAFDLDPTLVAKASLRTNGWAAGLRLISPTRSVDGVDTVNDVATLSVKPRDGQLLVDYFSELLQANVDEAGQYALLVAALLPSIPLPLLATLSGVADAEERLNRLCASNLFVERVAHRANTYRLHPLLREYLLERGRTLFEDGARQQMLRAAALGFNGLGDTDAAIGLYIEGGDWERVAELLLTVFEAKLAVGQLDQLAAWMVQLPAILLDGDAALCYCIARLCFLREESAALTHYERSCRAFALRGDILGQQLCAAGVLEWSYNADNFIDHQRWTALLRSVDCNTADTTTANELHQLRLLNGKLLACFFDGDFETTAAQWVDQVLGLLSPDGSENEKLCVAITLLGCLERHKRWDDAQLLAARMEAMIASPRVSMRLKIITRQQIAIDLHRQTGDYSSLRDQATHARTMAREYGFPTLQFEAIAALIYAAQYTGDDAETRRLLSELLSMVDPANIYHQRFGHQMRAWLELQSGHLNAAQEQAAALRAAVNRSDMPARFRATWVQSAIFVKFASGECDAARAELTQMIDDAEPGSKLTLQANLFALEAATHLAAGHTLDALDALRECFATAASVRYFGLLPPLRSELSALCAMALVHGVAPTFARELIQRRKLRPPSVDAEHWPWPLKILTLGQFAITADNTPITFAGKVPKKPLALLKALIAHGATDVAEDVLTDALWPDDDADAAHDAFNVALHRLRKLIPNGGTVLRLQDGKLSLDGDACWIDSRAFEHVVAAADDAASAGDDVMTTWHRAMSLYRGRFLNDDRDEPWALSARERMRSKFNRVITRYANALTEAGREREALLCYQRGIETDDLAEEFYQGVMRCALAQKSYAIGLAAYQRLERILSLRLGVKPSAASQLLKQQLLE